MPMTNAFRAIHFGPETFLAGMTPHVFLISIRDEPQAPTLHRGNPLHPLQVILTAPGDMPPLVGLEAAIGPLPAPHRMMRNVNPSTLMPREIIGEILRDAGGRLYEKLGDTVRPVSQLFTGPHGEMIDLAPVRDVTHEAAAPGALRHDQWRAAGASGETSAAHPGGDHAEADQDGEVSPRPGEQHSTRPLRELVRRLVPEPGLWRLARYADFIDAITPQLAEPRRLQPGHQLACYLQIYELGTTTPISALEEAAARDLGAAGKLMPLSYDLCRKFGLSLPRPAFAIAASRQVCSPGLVPAGARFMTLRVALDPTIETTAPPPISAIVPATAAAPAPQEMLPNAAMTVTTPGLKTSIPEEFSKPWNQRLSRDEAIYDMTLAESRGAWHRMLDALAHRVSRRDMKKWHALLFGKTLDQQLWAIKPPMAALRDARIRGWVEQTLRLGGYDVARMLVEWEIHWRCQGL